ncbi:MAG: DNA-binding protein WhiA [Firmicutes bacterium]|nr:DNA-binding protein WhiA [Bacillota bacterium]
MTHEASCAGGGDCPVEFYDRTKEELVRVMPARDCCRIAELSALVKTDGTIEVSEGSLSLVLADSNAAVARKIVALLREVGGSDVEVTVRKGRTLRRGNTYLVRIPKEADAVSLLERLGIWGDGGIESGIPRSVVRQRCCKRSYVRGAFLGAGYVSEPGRGYHLEIAVDDRPYGEAIAKLLQEFDIHPRIIERRDHSVVYLKDSDDVVELLRVMEATGALLDLENTRIVRSIRNNVNRLVNAENANVAKSVEASCRQIQDIELITEAMGLSRLPETLASIARARLDNPEASLSELGEMVHPPIGKSGVNHRMRRLARIAQRIRDRGEPGCR